MFNLRHNLRRAAVSVAAGVFAVSAIPTSAAASPFKDGVDADGSGNLNLDEFVIAMGERALRQRDTNKDGQLSSEEWLGKNKGKFQQMTLERFNTDGDKLMSVAEIVEVFSWVFQQRDKDKDGALAVSEAPKFLLSK